jgi:hypothetical protein
MPLLRSIAIRYPNGSFSVAYAEGTREYRDTMARLSLPSAKHNAPPYEDMGQGWNDQPRKMLRLLRKRLWLPASYDVGALARQIRAVIDALPSECPISEAAISIPHLAALYQDDLETPVSSGAAKIWTERVGT